VIALGVAVRWVHLAACILLVGSCTLVLLAGRSDRPTARAWEARVLGWARALVILAFVSGLLLLGYQTALLEGRASAALEPAALLRVLLQTQGGTVWLVRQSLLLLLAPFLSRRLDVTHPTDWQATRGESAVVALAALAPMAAAGHAAAVEPGTAAAIALDLGHLLAAGLWIGALPALAALLRAAAREEGADARPYAVLVARRFSTLALASVAALALTGILAALRFVPTVAGLVGTTYGRLLLVKLALLTPILGLGWLNRRRLLPALSGDAVTLGRPAMRWLAGFVGAEAVFGLLILGVVAGMSVTPPALHEQPTWPFSFRLSSSALTDSPDGRARALIGSQLAVVGVVAGLCALFVRSVRTPVLAGAVVVVALGLGLALPPLAIDAYPTTYVRPTIPYQAVSIAAGQRLFAQNCAVCHGPEGAGDGPAARSMLRPPADLQASHTASHTAGDLFWWITAGIPAAGMPGFGDRLSEDDRWDLVNFLRALGAVRGARGLGASVSTERPWLVAPDFSFGVGPMQRTLREYRGRRAVLLVLYTLPGSARRLEQIAAAHSALSGLGVEVIAVPTDAAPDALRHLAGLSPIFFPIVTEGASDIVTAYRLFADAPHAELLIDRQGYVRTRWATADPTRDVKSLLADATRLAEEPVTAPAPEAHVH
jgi:putative copper export protein/mono/diheme cytochrome c family protein